MDVATLTGAMSVALGTPATGVFSRKTRDWDTLARAGSVSGDRVWRMPLWKSYNDKMKKSPLADLNNISLTPGIKPKIVQRLHRDNYSGVCFPQSNFGTFYLPSKFEYNFNFFNTKTFIFRWWSLYSSRIFIKFYKLSFMDAP